MKKLMICLLAVSYAGVALSSYQPSIRSSQAITLSSAKAKPAPAAAAKATPALQRLPKKV